MKRSLIPALLVWILGVTTCPKAAPPAPDPDAKAKGALMEKMNRLILPEEPVVTGKTLEEAIDLLRVKAREADTASSVSEKGINIVLISGGEKILPATAGLKLRDVPFAEELRLVAGQVGMKCRVDAHAVVVTEADSDPPPPPLTEADVSTEREKRLLHSLSHRIRPSVSLHGCSIEEALEFLRVDQDCRETWDGKPRPPTNVALHRRDHNQLPTITLDLRDVSVLEALGYMTEMTGLKLSLRSSALVFSDHDLAPSSQTAMQRTPLGARASRITLRTVTFQDTRLEEALDFVHVKARDLDPQKQDMNIVVRPGGNSVDISLDLKEVSLLNVLDHIALQSGHRLSSEGDTFILTPTGAGGL